ncbi:MAG: hypothetical protein IJH75_03625 [Mogibacterium sp.]|nr:hypothetical protein [Mogibacterium sp.]
MTTYIALLEVCGVFIVGDILSKLIKNKVSGYIIAMFLFIIIGGQFGIITAQTFEDTALVGFTYAWGVPFGLTCFGASISLKSFKGELKTVVIALITVACIVLLGVVCAVTFLDKETAIYGTISVAGGAQAGLIFLTQLKETGNTTLSAIIVIIMNAQILIGYPACSFAMKKGMEKRLQDREGIRLLEASELAIGGEQKDIFKNLTFIDPFYLTFMVLAAIGLVGTLIANLTGISALVWCLLLGFLCSQFGIINGDSLKKIGADGLILTAMFAVILMDLCSVSLSDLAGIFPTLIFLLLLGIAGSAICAVICTRIFKEMGFWDIMAFALACMTGYPLTLRVAEECLQGLATKYEIPKDEWDVLNGFYTKKVVISGIISVSVVTGLLAGIVIGFI